MGALLQFTATLESVGGCIDCGMDFAIPSVLLNQLRENKKTFYCPLGHPMVFGTSTGDRLKAEAEKLRADLERVKKNEAWLQDKLKSERELADKTSVALRETRTRLRHTRERAKNGVCPCCQRSFVQLQRHMATKHPEFTP